MNIKTENKTRCGNLALHSRTVQRYTTMYRTEKVRRTFCKRII